MTSPRIVLSHNRLDLRKDRSLALKSILIEFGFVDAVEFVDTLLAIVQENDFAAYLKLPYYLRNPGLATCSCMFMYVLELLSRTALVDLVYKVAPPKTSGIGVVLPKIRAVDFTNYGDLLDYFGFGQVDPITFLQDPNLYLDWIEASLPELADFTLSVRTRSITDIITSVLYRQTQDNLLVHPDKREEIAYWVRVTFATTVLGSDYNQ